MFSIYRNPDEVKMLIQRYRDDIYNACSREVQNLQHHFVHELSQRANTHVVDELSKEVAYLKQQMEIILSIIKREV